MAWRAYRLLTGQEECSWLGHLVIGRRQQSFCLLAASHLPRPGAYGCRVFFFEDSQRLLPLTGLPSIWLTRIWGRRAGLCSSGASAHVCLSPSHPRQPWSLSHQAGFDGFLTPHEGIPGATLVALDVFIGPRQGFSHPIWSLEDGLLLAGQSFL